MRCVIPRFAPRGSATLFAFLLCVQIGSGTDTCTAGAPPGKRGGSRIIDISVPLSPKTPSFGSLMGLGDFREEFYKIEDGYDYNFSILKGLSVHSGTHVDAPSHFQDRYRLKGMGVESLDLEVLNGPALVVRVPDGTNITGRVLEELRIPPGTERILFKTDASDKNLMFEPEFYFPYTALVTDGAKFLLEKTDVKLIGIDYLSVSTFEDLVVPHQMLLDKEMVHVEGLVLSHVEPGLYYLNCLPVNLVASDGAPARCILTL